MNGILLLFGDTFITIVVHRNRFIIAIALEYVVFSAKIFLI